MLQLIHIITTLGLTLGGIFTGTEATATCPVPAGAPMACSQAACPSQAFAVSDGWNAKKSDHVCGLSDLKKVSNPAKVDYQKCLEATAPWKKMVDEGIDEDSVEGKALRAKAVRIVAKVAEKIRKEKGYCSVWKEISHSDGREIDDITDAVVEAAENENG